MRAEQDFAAFVAARGATVVRCLVLLGADLDEAEAAAAESFAALRADWDELISIGDPDVDLYRAVLAIRRRRGSAAEAVTPARVAAVLRHPAHLEEVQVCEVLGISVPELRALLTGNSRLVPELDAEADAVSAWPVPYARVRAVVSRQRRRRWTVSAAIAGGVATVLAVTAVLTSPEQPPEPGDALPAARAVALDNPSTVVWWADGVLHLEDSAVRVGAVRRLVAAGDGAAYVDDEGRLVLVRPDGGRTLLGRPARRSALVSSPRLGLVAWVDASVPGVTRMVVWDADEDQQVAAVVTSPGVRPITFDGGWLTFGQGLRDWAWDPAGGPARETGNGYADEPGERTALVDVVAGTRLEQMGSYLRVVRSGHRGEILVTGFGGQLSSDGRLVLTGPDPGRDPQLHDARTGDRLDSWFPPDWHVRQATFTADDRVTWVVERGDGSLLMVTCGATAAARPCTHAVDLVDVASVLLAADSAR